MRIVVTGSAGHLGEGLVRVLRERGDDVVGLDIENSNCTDITGSVADRTVVRRALEGADAVVHTATLHKPHVATHGRRDFLEVNVEGTLCLLEEAVALGVSSFVFTSTTSAFGRALSRRADGAAAWITEDVRSVPKNIYGVTKTAAEDVCQLVQQDQGLPVVVLRTSRFFPESDDDAARRSAYDDDNLKANEYLHRRVDLSDVVDAHVCALEHAADLGFRKYIISAPPPFGPDDAEALGRDATELVWHLFPDAREEYARRGWRMYPSIDRVYDSSRAVRELGWRPRYDFRYVIDELIAGREPRSALSRSVGAKGYHARPHQGDGPYPVG